MIYATTQGQIAMTTTDIKSLVCLGLYPEHLRIQNVDFGNVLRNVSGVRTHSPTELRISMSPECLRRHPSNLLKIPQNNGNGYNTECIQAIPNALRIHPGDILNYYSTL